MTSIQKAIKYLAIAFAALLSVGIIGGAVSVCAGVSFLHGIHNTAGDMQEYAVSDNVHSLDIDITAAALTVVTGDAWRVESNLEQLRVSEKNGRLLIEEDGHLFGISRGEEQLRITLPKDLTLREATITTGAGRVTVDALAAETLELSLGAGEVKLHRLTARKQATIEGGAGKITVSDSALAYLDLDMGVGAVQMNGTLTGRCEWNCGIGETAITLAGPATDYTVRLEKGLGDATVDGVPADDGAVYGHGQHQINIHGGIGAVRIRFAEE